MIMKVIDGDDDDRDPQPAETPFDFSDFGLFAPRHSLGHVVRRGTRNQRGTDRKTSKAENGRDQHAHG